MQMDGTYTASCSCDSTKPPTTFETLMETVEQFYRDYPPDPLVELTSRLGLWAITPRGHLGYRLPVEVGRHLPRNVIREIPPLYNIAMPWEEQKT